MKNSLKFLLISKMGIFTEAEEAITKPETIQTLSLEGLNTNIHKADHTGCEPQDIQLPKTLTMDSITCGEDHQHLVCTAAPNYEWECQCNREIPGIGIVLYDENHCHWDSKVPVITEGEESGEWEGQEDEFVENYLDEYEWLDIMNEREHLEEIQQSPVTLDNQDQFQYPPPQQSPRYSQPSYSNMVNDVPVSHGYQGQQGHQGHHTLYETPSTCPMLSDDWNCSRSNHLRSMCTRACPTTRHGMGTTRLAKQKCLCIYRYGKPDCGWKVKGRACGDFGTGQQMQHDAQAVSQGGAVPGGYYNDMMDYGNYYEPEESRAPPAQGDKRLYRTGNRNTGTGSDDLDEQVQNIKKLLAESMNVDVKHSTINIYM